MIELRRMHYFVTLAEELHFGRAALRLGIAQSALSTQIKALETELGARLFIRNKRSSIALTDAGQLFLVEARRVLDQAARAELVGRRAGRGELGCIEIGDVLSVLFTEVLTRLIRDCHEAHPQVEFRIHAMTSPQQMRQLGDGRLDIAIVGPRSAYPVGTEAVGILRQEIALALPADHPAALRFPMAVPAAALAESPFIIVPYNEEGGHEGDLAAIAARGGFSPATIERVSDMVDALGLVQAGLGVTILPAPLQRLGLPGVAYRALADVTRTVDLMAVFHKAEKSPAAADFIAALRRVARGVTKKPDPRRTLIASRD